MTAARLRVWAPASERVELVLGEERVEMRQGEGGWWDGPTLEVGRDYAFSLDGSEPLPDPRSQRQPDGVHGPSRTVDHGAFRWTDAGFRARPLESAVIYEAHIGTFTTEGTFDAAIERLDHLVKLGVTHLQVMPVAAFPGRAGWGYDGVHLFAPHEPYGGPDGFKRLVDAAHGRGLAVILDVVYNHLGPSGNVLGRFGPYFTDRYRTPWGDAVNFDDRGSDEVRRFVIDDACMWLRDYHVDGLRLDAVHAIVDTSATHILEALSAEVAKLGAASGRDLVLIAESDLNDPRLIRSPSVGGYGLDAQWSDDFHHALHAVLTGDRAGYYADFGSLEDVATALREAYVYAGRHSAFRGRIHGRAATGIPAHRFLGYVQNHDQIGNRARGERLSALVTPGRARVAAALILLGPFVPMLFQGEEWAASTPFQYFTDHDDADLARAVSEGRRREFEPFGWRAEDVPDPQDPATVGRSVLDWDERTREPHASALAWHRALIALRAGRPELRDPDLSSVVVRCSADEGWLVLERHGIVVACSIAPVERLVPASTAGATVLLASDDGVRLAEDGIVLPPDSVAVVERGVA
jgi:maltooligosyltrehalose trehalohydrolase